MNQSEKMKFLNFFLFLNCPYQKLTSIVSANKKPTLIVENFVIEPPAEPGKPDFCVYTCKSNGGCSVAFKTEKIIGGPSLVIFPNQFINKNLKLNILLYSIHNSIHIGIHLKCNKSRDFQFSTDIYKQLFSNFHQKLLKTHLIMDHLITLQRD